MVTLAEYKKELEQLLEPLGVSISITPSPIPPIELYELAGATRHLVKKYYTIDMAIQSRSVGRGINMSLMRDDQDINNPSRVWADAEEIQRNLYGSAGRDPGSPQDDDPYWELWNKRPHNVTNK
jgi:hypothetical protein